jgi:chaperonin GroES
MVLKPLGKRILVLPDEVPSESNGIILPDYTKEKPWQGTVVEVSDNLKLKDNPPPIGSKVHYRQGHGKETIMDGKTYELLAIEDVLGIIGTEMYRVTKEPLSLVNEESEN